MSSADEPRQLCQAAKLAHIVRRRERSIVETLSTWSDPVGLVEEQFECTRNEAPIIRRHFNAARSQNRSPYHLSRHRGRKKGNEFERPAAAAIIAVKIDRDGCRLAGKAGLDLVSGRALGENVEFRHGRTCLRSLNAAQDNGIAIGKGFQDLLHAVAIRGINAGSGTRRKQAVAKDDDRPRQAVDARQTFVCELPAESISGKAR